MGSPYTETNKHGKDDIKYCMYVQTVQPIRQTIIFIIQFKSNLYFRLYPLYKVKGGPYKTHIKYIIIKVWVDYTKVKVLHILGIAIIIAIITYKWVICSRTVHELV